MKKPSFIDKIANSLGYVKSAVKLSIENGFGLPSFPFYKTKKYLEAYRSWVFACTKARATDVAKLKLHLYKVKDRKTGEVEEVFDHDVLSLLRSVNPFMTRRQLIEYTQAYKDLSGEAFWYLVRGGQGKNGKIVQIWMLRPDWVNIQTDPDEFIKEYIYRVPGQDEIRIPRNDVIHFKEFNPEDPFRGISIVRAAATTIDIDSASEDYNKKFYDNSALPQVVLQTAQKLDDSIVKRMRAQWNNEFQGTNKAHGVAILEGGLELKPYALSQKDMEFLEGQRYTRDKILALFQVPKTVLGMTEDVTVSNAEATDLVFSKRVVDPEMDKIVDTLNEFLLPQFPDWKGGDLFFDKDSPVPENVLNKLETQKAMFGMGALSPNEVRNENGYDEVPGLDDYYVPMNLVSVTKEDDTGNEEPVKHAKRRLIKKIDPLTLKEKVTREVSEKVSNEVVGVIRKNFQEHESERNLEPATMPVEEQEALWKTFVQKAESAEKKYIDELKAYFKRQEQETLDRLNSITKGIDRSHANKVLFNLATENKVGANIFVPILMELLEEHGNDALDALGLDDTVFDATTASVNEFKKNEALKGVKATNKTTRASLKKILSKAVAEGSSVEEIARMIRSVFDEASNVRSLRIARTETIRAANRGALEAYKQSGVVIGKQWFTALDERVCEWCGPMNGRIKALDNNFFHQGESFVGKEGGMIHLDYSAIGEPPLHPNCRCTLIPITNTSKR